MTNCRTGDESQGRIYIPVSLALRISGDSNSQRVNGQVRKNLMGATGWIAYKGLIGKSGKTIEQKRKLKNGQIKTYTIKLTAAQWNKQLAFLIARKIHKKGFKGTNWFSSELKNFESEIIVEMTKLTGRIVNLSIETFTK